MNFRIFATALIASVGLSACGSAQPGKIDVTDGFAGTAEIDRLRYFREIDALPVLKEDQLSGKGVRVTIMGEMVDASHPDLNRRVVKQYNTFSKKGAVIPGSGNQPYRGDLLTLGDGHGTHIAGTIAAECDGVGVQGVACNSRIDVYNLGAYDSAASFPIEGWGDTGEFGRFFTAFAAAVDDLTRRGESRISTGSFNLEGPAIRITSAGPLRGRTTTQIFETIENEIDGPEDLFGSGLVELKNPDDAKMLEQLVEEHDDPSIAASALMPLSTEWAALEDALARYQAKDGVYIVTESNYDFSDRTSVLNAMPSLSTKVDADLWLSVVMAVPTGLAALSAEGDFTEEDLNRVMRGPYETPLNSCGAMASEYCILTPSWTVMSTMTERVAFPDTDIVTLDGRTYQSLDGHSMGAPMVAATLALMEEENRRKGYGHTMKNLVRILKDNANRSFPGYDPAKHGRGILDVTAAIRAMAPATNSTRI